MSNTPTYDELSALCAQMAAALEAMIDHVADDDDEADEEWDCVKKSRAALTAYRTLSPDPQWQRVPEGCVVVSLDLLGEFPEINPANYGEDEVIKLNEWGISIVNDADKRARGEG